MPQTLLTFSVLTVLQDTRFGYNYLIILPHSFTNRNEIFWRHEPGCLGVTR